MMTVSRFDTDGFPTLNDRNNPQTAQMGVSERAPSKAGAVQDFKIKIMVVRME